GGHVDHGVHVRRRAVDEGRPDPRPREAVRRLVDHLDAREAPAPGRARRQRDVELEVGRVDVRERLGEREALRGGDEIERVRAVRDDAPVAGAAAVGGEPHVGAGRETSALAPARERMAGAEAAQRERMRGMELAVVVEDGPDAVLAGDAGDAGGRCAVAVEHAGLRRRDRARALGGGVAVAAVPYPAADGGHAIARAGPGEKGIAADLELELELARLLAPGTDVAGRDDP